MRLITLYVFFLPLLMVFLSVQGNCATLSGRLLMTTGEPISGGVVVAFDLQTGIIPAPNRYFRIPDHVADIQTDGNFSINLPLGEYAIACVKRVDGRAGPPREGDIFSLLKDEGQNLRHFIVPQQGTLQLGDLAVGEFYHKLSDPLDPVTAITGKVTDNQGQPVNDVTVAATYEKPGTKNNHFIALETDSNGVYFLPLPSGGKYSIGIWDSGGPENAYELFLKTLQIESGEILQEINLTY